MVPLSIIYREQTDGNSGHPRIIKVKHLGGRVKGPQGAGTLCLEAVARPEFFKGR